MVDGGLPDRLMWEHSLTYITDRFHQLFNPYTGYLPVDVVITNNPGAAALLPMYLSMHAGGPVPCILVSIGAITDETDSAYISRDNPSAILAAIGYAESMCVFSTPGDMKAARDHVARNLSSVHVKRFDENAVCLPFSFDSPALTSRELSRPDRFRVLWTGRPNSAKAFGVCVNVLKDLVAVRDDAQVIVHAAVPPAVAAGVLPARDSHWSQVKPGVPKAEFYALMRSCHVGLNLSSYEAGNLAVVEQICAGVLLVLPNRPWAKDIVGRDYPLLASGSNQALTLLCDVLENYESWVKRLRPFREIIAATSQPDLQNRVTLGQWRRALSMKSYPKPELRTVKEALVEARGKRRTLTLPVAYSTLSNMLASSPQRLRTNKPGYVHRMLRRYDTLDTAVPTYDLSSLEV